MPVPIEVHKEQAERLLHCLATGTPIDPPKGPLDLLNVAGACLFAAASVGPWAAQPDLSSEQQAESHVAIVRDMAGAVEYLAAVVFAILHHGHYDQQWDAHMTAVVYGDTQQVEPVDGWRT